jgi:hypothetical protein
MEILYIYQRQIQKERQINSKTNSKKNQKHTLLLKDAIWKKFELPNLHTYKKIKCKGKILIWNPKKHQQNIARGYQQATIKHNK